MPYDLVTPFGTRRGQVTPDEEMSQRSAIQAAQIAALRAQTDATYQLGHEQIGQEASRFGTYQQQQDAGRQNAALEHAYSMETGAQKGGFDLAGKGLEYGANNTLADIERRKYEEGLPLRQEEMSSQVDFLRQLRARMGGVMGSPGAQSPGEAGPNPGLPSTSPAGAPGGGMSPEQMDQMSMYAAILNHKDPGDMVQKQMQRQMLQMALEDAQRKRTKERQAELLGQDPTAARAAAQASGVPLEIPKIEDVMSNPEMGPGKTLADMSGSFAQKDTKMFGWDPTDQDVQQVIGERDRLVQILVGRGYPQQDALREANRVVQQKLAPGQGDLNAGWIQKLQQRGGF